MPPGYLNSTNIELIYSRGIELREAHYRFANPAIRKKLSLALENTSKIQYPEPTEKDDGWKFALQALSKFGQTYTQLNLVENEAKRYVIEQLRSKYAFALGYALPRHISDCPVFVPADLFTPASFKWENNLVAGNGLEFFGVRLIEKIELEKLANTTPLEKFASNKRSPGRPSARNLILAAYEELKIAGRINYSAPRKIAILDIQASIRKSHGQNLVPSEETIRRAISKEFREPRN